MGCIEIADGIFLASLKTVVFYHIQILGLVFIDRKEAVHHFARIQIDDLKGMRAILGHEVSIV